MKKLFLIFLIAFSILGMSLSSASADNIAVSLVMDVSGSISADEYNLQKQGYANALNQFFSDNSSLFGSVTMNVFEFGGNNNNSIGWTTISDASGVNVFYK